MKKPPQTKSVPGIDQIRKSVSHAEIAQEAGVSRSMVSAFLNGTQYRSGEKRGVGVGSASVEKIRAACGRLEYFPADTATLFRVFPEKAPIGLLLERNIPSGFSSPVHALIFEGIANCACDEGIELTNLFYEGTYDYLVDPRSLPGSLLRGAIRKVIVVGGMLNYSLIHQLLAMEVAVVLVGKAPRIPGTVAVVPDFFNASRAALHHLNDYGHKDIAIVMNHFTGPDTYHGRLIRDGCARAMKELEVKFKEEDIVVLNGFGSGSASALAAEILQRKPRPSAIYCLNGETARSLALELAFAGVSIPDDISLIVGDDDLINQLASRRFSSIHLDYRQMGERAFRELNLLAVRGAPEKEDTIVIPFEVMDCGSVRRI